MGYVIKASELESPPSRLRERAVRDAEGALDEACAAQRLARDRDRVADVAAFMAERIVGEALERRPELLAALFERAMREIGSLRPGRIRVHPDDRGRSGIDGRAAARGLDVVEDASVGRGGCAVEACGVSSDHSLAAVVDALRAAARGKPGR
jgi:flagellar biosynthesis/type III secretory pathway protein FliH